MKRNPKEMARRTKEVALQVAKTNHLKLEFCQDCGWPLIASVRSNFKYVQCSDCREEKLAKKQWDKKCQDFQETQAEVREVPVETKKPGTNEDQPNPVV
jgi:hypothetical protein